jgi:hypothetical protein
MILRPSIVSDPKNLAPHLRAVDVAEVAAVNGWTGRQALEAGLQMGSECWTFVDDEIGPVGMSGVVPDLEILQDAKIVAGHVWLLGSKELTACPKEFMRLSRELLTSFEEQYTILSNYVDVRNTKSIRWLKALGFSFGTVEPQYGTAAIPFIEFWKTTGE